MSESNITKAQEACIKLRRLTARKEDAGHTEEWTLVWSSALLEETIEEILSLPMDVSDLFQGAWELMKKAGIPLNRTTANFVRDLVTLCFICYRSSYHATEFQWMATQVAEKSTELQAYFASLALPEKFIYQCRDAILSKLEGTEFSAEIRSMLFANDHDRLE